jgi:hypothetical protein
MDQAPPPAIVAPAPENSGPTMLILSNGDRMVVSINVKDGAVTFGPGFAADEAARQFWIQVGKASTRCPPTPQ